MTSKTLDNNCTCCGVEWMDKKDISYKNMGSKSRSFVSGYQLLSKYGREKIQLVFCNLHGNNLRAYTKVTNQGILKIRNTSSNRWRNAASVGEIV